ncbi:hypothetical protein B296_00008241 [Ensete ventricosum]|uniref:Serine-threonine/tyrosine-protein kinase catalytic domain-containing protein n=1 Tax=Ensete ventricosum TaxID=4639 RepID=A0A427B417_ENSVE|nr:hypothetical protein B296_00008241 [Ensete ventricosum]
MDTALFTKHCSSSALANAKKPSPAFITLYSPPSSRVPSPPHHATFLTLVRTTAGDGLLPLQDHQCPVPRRRVPPRRQARSTYQSPSPSPPLLSFVLLVILLVILFWGWALEANGDAGEQDQVPAFKEYGLAELRAATKGFSPEMIVSESGEKAPNVVYRGKLDGGRLVAVKRFSKQSWPDAQQFVVGSVALSL